MTRADHIHQARVYLAESRRTRHRAWAFTLLEWAGNRRRMALQAVSVPVQGDLFGGRT